MPNADVIKHFIHPSKTSCEYAHVHCFQNALAYFALLVSYPRKMFMKLKPSAGVIKHFMDVTYGQNIDKLCHQLHTYIH